MARVRSIAVVIEPRCSSDSMLTYSILRLVFRSGSGIGGNTPMRAQMAKMRRMSGPRPSVSFRSSTGPSRIIFSCWRTSISVAVRTVASVGSIWNRPLKNVSRMRCSTP